MKNLLHKNQLTVWTLIGAIICFRVNHCYSKFASYEYIESSEISSGDSSIVRFLETTGDQAGERATIVTQPDNLTGTGNTKRRRVIRRRKKVIPSSTAVPVTNDKEEISATAEPSIFKIFKLDEPPLILDNSESNDITRVQSLKRPQKKRHHKINHDVWKASSTLALNDVILNQGESESDISQVGKRESGETRNKTKSASGEFSPDLHTEESNNAFVNSSTPISNELQNSLQFTLQFLHPLLNSDTILSEGDSKTPENKTVDITHSLSDTVAQTPIAHDLGFVPTNLRKKHPLLNHDSIFSSQNGASKSGILTHIQPPVQSQIDPYAKPDRFTTTMKTTTGHLLTTPSTPVVTISLSTVSTPTTQAAQTVSVSKTTSSVSKSSQPKVTIAPKVETKETFTSTRPVTTPVPFRSSEIPSPVSTVKSSSNAFQTTTQTITTSNNRGVLNITEVTTTEKSPPTAASHDYKSSYSSIITEMISSLNEGNSHSTPIYGDLSSIRVTTQRSPIAKDTGAKHGSKEKDSSSSAETTSAEQLLIEQLLGIGAGAPADSPLSIPSQGDSNELLQLFSLVQNQSQNKRNPVTLPTESFTFNQSKSSGENIPNIFETLLSQKPQSQVTSTSPTLTSTGTSLSTSNPGLANLNLLQALLNSQSNAGSSSGPQLDLDTLLSLATQDFTSSSVPPTIGAIRPAPLPGSSGEGLSDADLKSIFALIESQTSTSTTIPSTTTKSTTTTTPATTTTQSTTTTPKPQPTVAPTQPSPIKGPLTTTLHPALQSMLDLFTNQLKPFQSIPSPSAPIAASPSEPRQNIVTTSTQSPPQLTVAPTVTSAPATTTTQNSLDLLAQLLNFGTPQGTNKVNPVRSNPAASPAAPVPEFSLASLFGGSAGNTNNLFSSNFLNPQPASTPQTHAVPDSNAQSGSNQLLNYFGGSQSSFLQPTTTPPPPSGLYYWLDMNAFLGGDPKADPMSGIRPKMGYKHPFIKVN